MLHNLCFAPCLTHTPPLTARFVHPSAVHSYLYLFLPAFLAATFPSSSSGEEEFGRFLFFAATFLPAAFREEPSPRLAAAAAARRVEVD